MNVVEIQSMLVLSTNHLSTKTTEALSGNDAPADSLPWSPQLTWDHGWLWYVDGDTINSANFPAEFEAIFKLALSHGCCWVRFDESGPTLDSLPSFDW